MDIEFLFECIVTDNMNAARAYRRLKETEEQKLANRLALLEVIIVSSYIT